MQRRCELESARPCRGFAAEPARHRCGEVGDLSQPEDLGVVRDLQSAASGRELCGHHVDDETVLEVLLCGRHQSGDRHLVGRRVTCHPHGPCEGDRSDDGSVTCDEELGARADERVSWGGDTEDGARLFAAPKRSNRGGDVDGQCVIHDDLPGENDLLQTAGLDASQRRPDAVHESARS